MKIHKGHAQEQQISGLKSPAEVERTLIWTVQARKGTRGNRELQVDGRQGLETPPHKPGPGMAPIMQPLMLCSVASVA